MSLRFVDGPVGTGVFAQQHRDEVVWVGEGAEKLEVVFQMFLGVRDGSHDDHFFCGLLEAVQELPVGLCAKRSFSCIVSIGRLFARFGACVGAGLNELMDPLPFHVRRHLLEVFLEPLHSLVLLWTQIVEGTAS